MLCRACVVRWTRLLRPRSGEIEMRTGNTGFMRKSNEQVDCAFVPPLNASQSEARKRKLRVWIERALPICGAALLARA